MVLRGVLPRAQSPSARANPLVLRGSRWNLTHLIDPGPAGRSGCCCRVGGRVLSLYVDPYYMF